MVQTRDIYTPFTDRPVHNGTVFVVYVQLCIHLSWSNPTRQFVTCTVRGLCPLECAHVVGMPRPYFTGENRSSEVTVTIRLK